MDEHKMLEDAKKTIDNIKQTQGALDEYLLRLEKIVRQLENELYKDAKLTVSDVTSINEQLTPEMLKESEEAVEEIVEKKKKFKFNVILFLSVISLMLTLGIQYIKLQEVIHFGNSSYLIYNQVNMEPNIKMNSLVVIDNEKTIKEKDTIAYTSKHNVIKIQEVDRIEDDKYVVQDVNRAIKSYEDVPKESALGVVKESHYKIGEVLSVLLKYILILYLMTFLLFVIGILTN